MVMLMEPALFSYPELSASHRCSYDYILELRLMKARLSFFDSFTR